MENTFNKTKPVYYHPAIERLRVILMLIMCINLFGFPGAIGNFIQSMCNFVSIAFFIISGYLVLRPDKDRLKRIARSIKHCAIAFFILAAVYFVINAVYYYFLGINIFAIMANKRFWFNFLVMNVWQFDIGGSIWYVQALLYAYIIIYVLDKLKLLKFDWLIFIIFMIFTIVSGELSGILKWNILGYSFIPGNFLTRALPYVLLGNIIHRNIDKFLKLTFLKCLIGIIIGFLLMILENGVLDKFGFTGYYGHLIGMPIVAFFACIPAFTKKDRPGFEKKLGLSRKHVNHIYYLAPIVSIIIAIILKLANNKLTVAAASFISLITFASCLLISIIMSYFARKHNNRKEKKEKTNCSK
ncbi:MAG: hypothetical protein KBS52_00245 [Clostridiales bacterium]|nr:hypothetical protein [Candidatus Equinaster intestinalis]